MCATTTPTRKLRPISQWSNNTVFAGGFAQREVYTYAIPGFGTFAISPLRPDGVAVTGWKLTVTLVLPYGITGKPYQLSQTADLKNGAAKMVKAATAFFNDQAAQLKAMQAVLDAVLVQHVG